MQTQKAAARMQRHTNEEADWYPEVASEAARISQYARPEGLNEEGYFGIPLLKQPTWRWQIAWYFFLEGVSAGSFLLSGLAEFLSNRKLSRLARIGFYVSFAAVAPCPPLLIADLGHPARFSHMLRIFKAVSPMSVGSWTLTMYGAPLTLLFLKQAAEDFKIRGSLRGILDAIPRRALIMAATPGAAIMTCYTGVLLSTTSNPLWHRSRFVGPLFACAAFSAGASALSLTARLAGGNRSARKVLQRIHQLSAAAEIISGAGYAAESGRAATPLLRGRHAAMFFAGIAGMISPLLVRKISCRRATKKNIETVAAAMALAGGLALKWAIVYAGRTSAVESNSARIAADCNDNE